MITYNVLLEVPDDLDIMEQHEVEYEEEVPVFDEEGIAFVVRPNFEYVIQKPQKKDFPYILTETK